MKSRNLLTGVSHKHIAAIAAVAIFLMGVGLLWKQDADAESPRIVHGSNVTVLYQIIVPGEGGFEIRVFGQFVQGRHQLPPALERAVTGMKTGDKIKVELTAEEGFGPYDAGKRKTVPKSDLPAGTKEGDVLESDGGQRVTVAQLSDRSAVVDYNHPLAGKDVVMKMMILRVDNPI
jgi:FKBP-type peptidyl-prolyl cis-trans isomerase 2